MLKFRLDGRIMEDFTYFFLPEFSRVLIAFRPFWLTLVSRPRATVKYPCTTHGTFVSAVRGKHRTVSVVCLKQGQGKTYVKKLWGYGIFGWGGGGTEEIRDMF